MEIANGIEYRLQIDECLIMLLGNPNALEEVSPFFISMSAIYIFDDESIKLQVNATQHNPFECKNFII